MIKTFTVFLIMCCFFLASFGQSKDLILTEAQNNRWFDSLAILPLGNQLQMIKQRLLADTNVFVWEGHPDNGWVKWKADSLGNRVYGLGKPTIIVGTTALLIDNKTVSKKIVASTQLLTMDYIDSITLLKGTDPATTAIYGSLGRSGIIHMKLKKKKDEKQFKKQKLTKGS